MKPAAALNPLRLDVAAFAERGHELKGEWSLSVLSRLMEDAPGPSDAHAVWQARGEQRPVRGGAPQLWLHLRVQAPVQRVCQRCLQPVTIPLDVERAFRFAPDEEAAQALDADAEEDVLALTRSLNLQELVEDELLLALPLVPRHEVCPQPLPLPAADEAPDEPEAAPDRPNPFAVLARLKKKPD